MTETFADLPAAVRPVFDTVAHRNPHEPEFLQAVHEVLGTIVPVLEQHPAFGEAAILERLGFDDPYRS